MLRGTTDLPLHYGSSPRWLFDRMKKLAKALTEILILEYGKKTFLERLSDPYWFQCFACSLGFDWHSSGTTTVTLAALKEALKESEFSQELVVCGGKGKTSRKTPEEIRENAEKINLSDKKTEELVRASRLAAKVDNAALQDGFSLYHHSFIFTSEGFWCIIQQGMNDRWARRYHWLGKQDLDFVNEPHTGIISDTLVRPLNMVAKEAEEARKASVELAKEKPFFLEKEVKKHRLVMQKEHYMQTKEIKISRKILEKIYNSNPQNYEELLLVEGTGPTTIRALALLSNLIYGTELSWRDPCKYAFAHGGKDGWPYPVNKKQYDKSIEILQHAIKNAKIGNKERLEALKRIKHFISW
ncbi:MAG: DUF763 domain-containing protein [Candidatus Pacearchaeota archaeon]|nr:DUF763 domain-containing protein [Candidatus Pacearchaeota archaeon]